MRAQDLVALARAFLDDPHWAIHAADNLRVAAPALPKQYARANRAIWPNPRAERTRRPS